VDDDAVTRLLADQSGVIARHQVLELGGTDADIRRRVRRREWKRVHTGVYVNHTGELSWVQRAWAAILVLHPAALSGWSALRAHKVRGADRGERQLVEVAIDESRRVRAPRGLRVRRVSAFDELVQAHLSPPRMRLEHAALDVAASQSSEDAAVATLADICQSGRSTPQRLRDALVARPTLPRRRILLEILDDVASGAYSALERRYLVRVERRHGLPTGHRQRRVTGGRRVYFRDVEYVGTNTLVELDGRLGHEGADDRWDDLERDLSAALSGDLTLRIGWRQVLEPCRVAAVVVRILMARGWAGPARSCRPGCPAGSGGSQSPAD
jgi:hypothetical protein